MAGRALLELLNTYCVREPIAFASQPYGDWDDAQKLR